MIRSVGVGIGMELNGAKWNGVTVIHPGFVSSDISKGDNQGDPRPERESTQPARLVWPTEKGAKAVIRAYYKRRIEHTFTVHGKFGIFMGRHFPRLTYFIMSRGPARRQAEKVNKIYLTTAVNKSQAVNEDSRLG